MLEFSTFYHGDFTMTITKLDYASAGVNITRGNELVEKIKPIAASTQRPELLGGIGGFGALCEIPKRYRHPVLVSSTDGVGTKLKLALALEKHHSIGIDLVAMCVNDIIAQGAEPLFFLDYYATAHLDVDIAEKVIQGIAAGCKLAGAALVGGETAEMPGIYQGKDYDLAGFCVGVVEKENIISSALVSAGDSLIGIASSGPHANGFSLIRKILELNNSDLNQTLNGLTLGEHLLTPTEIYVKPLLALMAQTPVHGVAHITGGGLLENIPRILPKHTKALIKQSTWEWPAIFKWLQAQGNIDFSEMYRTFNCGVGMVICVPAQTTASVLNILNQSTRHAWMIGSVESSTKQTPHTEIQ